MDLPSTKPYLLRALWEWCNDNGFTPYIAVDVDGQTQVPKEFVQDGRIVLNVGLEATNRLHIGNDFVEFQARFGGVARDICVPIQRISAIYSRENGAGMSFEVEDSPENRAPSIAPVPSRQPVAPAPETPPPEDPKPPAGRPHLQRIK